MRKESASNWNTWEDFLTIRSCSPIKQSLKGSNDYLADE